MYLKVESTDTASKLSELLKDGDWMVLYYAEWCGHCKTLKPEWEKVIDKLKDSGKVNIADVKSDFIEALPHKPKIEGFPTIQMYNKGREVAKFEDDRIAEKIEKFAVSNSNYSNTADTVKLNMNELEAIPSPTDEIVGDNQVKNLSISQLKDEIMKSHHKLASKSKTIENNENNVIEITNENMQVNTPREFKSKSKKQVEDANTVLSELDMLIQPPVPSIKASKKPTLPKKTLPKRTLPKKTLTQGTKRNNKVVTVAKIACSEIKKAKSCKTNPKCLYDYVEFKCKDKSEKPAPKHNKIVGAKKASKRTKRTQRQSPRSTKEYGTKSLLQALQKSFKKIGNEARKDSNLLEKASERI